MWKAGVSGMEEALWDRCRQRQSAGSRYERRSSVRQTGVRGISDNHRRRDVRKKIIKKRE